MNRTTQHCTGGTWGGILRVIGILVLCAIPVRAEQQPPEDGARELYERHCMSCHGVDLRGGRAQSLLDDQWVVENPGPESYARVIREGMPQQAMPAFAGTLDTGQIRALVTFIRQHRTQAAQEPPAEIPAIHGEVISSRYHQFQVEELTDELEIPWALAFLPDGRLLITDMAGQLRVFQGDRLLNAPVQGLPPTPPYVEGGLMDVAVEPGVEKNPWIYLAYAEVNEDHQAMTRLIRGKLDSQNQWSRTQTVWEVAEKFYSSAGSHFGVRILFHRGWLYFCIGDRHNRWNAQDPGDPRGKVHRIHPDGRVPGDNPFSRNPDTYATLWTLGHRNPQGLETDPRTGSIYLVEHGPYGGDEVNLLVPGGNYGWPEVTHGREYSGALITDHTEKPGMESPLTHWTPSIAPGGAAFSPGGPFPQWRGDLFVSSLVEGNLRRLRFSLEGQLQEEEIILEGLRRTREVAIGPDGLLYLTAERPGRILRLTPAK